jgi:hypothetical protein
MEQNKKEVVFDGKDLIFNVDGIEIKNGKLPDSFSIKERYEISAESLTKLVVALGDGNTLAEFNEERRCYGIFKTERTIYPLKDDYVKKLAEEVKSLQEKVYAERRRASDEEYKRYLLENLIKEHNKRSWWGRAERIELKTEE